MKLIHVLPYSLAVRTLFQAHYPAIADFDKRYADPFLDHTWQPEITDVENIIVPLGLQHQNQADTDARNLLMDQVRPFINLLEYKILACIKEGTITTDISTFCLSDFKRSITKKDISLFHTTYNITLPLVAANQTALTEQGFETDKTKRISELHESAWTLQTEKIGLDVQISDLSAVNQNTVNSCLNLNQFVINGLKAYADFTGNTDLSKQATAKAILKTVVPSQPKKPRKRTIKPLSSTLVLKEIPAKDHLQITLMTDVKVLLCRCDHKNDECTAGITLAYKTTWLGHKSEIPGSGEYIKLTNLSPTTKAIVTTFHIEVSR